MRAVNQLDAASMKLVYAAAMADVLHDVAFKDLTDDTLQAYIHGLREQIVAAKELIGAMGPAAMRDGAVAPGQSSTVPSDATRDAALHATYEISALADRINAEAVSGIATGDTDIVIRSHARRITQLGNALMRFVDEGDGRPLADAGLFDADTEHSTRVSQ